MAVSCPGHKVAALQWLMAAAGFDVTAEQAEAMMQQARRARTY
jgi:hypothetical protein